jgi:3-isopropylmalate/(R)-2-methylmalate dehydratase small subunit
VIEGRALTYASDNINTDVIWPGKYTYVQVPPEEMRRYAMETLDPDFPEKVEHHKVLVVGNNFGCGSSREQAAECLKYSGIEAVIAKSFARLFFRNAINVGLPVVESPEAVAVIRTGDVVRIDLAGGLIVVGEHRLSFPAFPARVLELLRDGGLINHLRRRS